MLLLGESGINKLQVSLRQISHIITDSREKARSRIIGR
mgnify:FL=1|jgi:hypothetical protein